MTMFQTITFYGIIIAFIVIVIKKLFPKMKFKDLLSASYRKNEIDDESELEAMREKLNRLKEKRDKINSILNGRR